MNAVFPSLVADFLSNVANEMITLETTKGNTKSCSILRKSSPGNEMNMANSFGVGLVEFCTVLLTRNPARNPKITPNSSNTNRIFVLSHWEKDVLELSSIV